MMIQQIFRTTFLGAVLALAACSTAKIEDPAEQERLRNLTAPADMALVYFVRPAAVGAAISMSVTCDGSPIGATNGKRYIFAYVKPGKREFVSKAENKDELLIELEAGKTYYFEQEVKMGILYARNRLSRLEDADGKRKLAKCKLSGDCPAYVPAGAPKK